MVIQSLHIPHCVDIRLDFSSQLLIHWDLYVHQGHCNLPTRYIKTNIHVGPTFHRQRNSLLLLPHPPPDTLSSQSSGDVK